LTKKFSRRKERGGENHFLEFPASGKSLPGSIRGKIFPQAPRKGAFPEKIFLSRLFLKSREFPFQSIARGSETPASREGQTADLDGVEKKACGGRGK